MNDDVERDVFVAVLAGLGSLAMLSLGVLAASSSRWRRLLLRVECFASWVWPSVPACLRCPGLLFANHFDEVNCIRSEENSPGLASPARRNVKAQKFLAGYRYLPEQTKERRGAQRVSVLHLHAAPGGQKEIVHLAPFQTALATAITRMPATCSTSSQAPQVTYFALTLLRCACLSVVFMMLLNT